MSFPAAGVYEGSIRAQDRDLSFSFVLIYGPLIFWDPNDVVTNKNEVYGLFALQGEAGPYTFCYMNYDVEKSFLDLRYSRLGNSSLYKSDWSLFFKLDDIVSGTAYGGDVYARSVGLLGKANVNLSAKKSLQLEHTIVGTWQGTCIGKDGRILPTMLRLEAGQRSVDNPVDYDLAFTPSKVGSLKIDKWLFALPSVTIDYLSGRIHCVHKVTENGARLQLAGTFDKDGNVEGVLESSQNGIVGHCSLKKI